jgi:hypothetical protein
MRAALAEARPQITHELDAFAADQVAAHYEALAAGPR